MFIILGLLVGACESEQARRERETRENLAMFCDQIQAKVKTNQKEVSELEAQAALVACPIKGWNTR